MNYLRRLFLLPVLALSLTLTGCLDIEEEVTYRADGSGKYALKMDMSQMKSMIEMFKTMGDAKGENDGEVVSDMEPTKDGAVEVPAQPTEVAIEEAAPAPVASDENPAAEITKLGDEFTKSLESLKGLKGIKNAVANNDTTNLMFGYSFEFENVEALNNAIYALNKDKFEGKKAPAFVADKKNFQRTSAFDMGQLISQAMSQGEEAEGMDMVKMFFADMKYTQVYHFDKKVKKSANADAQISADGKTVTLVAKPFSDGASTKSVTNTLKLK